MKWLSKTKIILVNCDFYYEQKITHNDRHLKTEVQYWFWVIEGHFGTHTLDLPFESKEPLLVWPKVRENKKEGRILRFISKTLWIKQTYFPSEKYTNS